ncbi:hypothetical protein FRB95_010352 [Tulasnella sp. JGI-2019a]|nr:hypothetical protein FRB95_010352 [Tulasnella sp. JGI-2019a]
MRFHLSLSIAFVVAAVIGSIFSAPTPLHGPLASRGFLGFVSGKVASAARKDVMKNGLEAGSQSLRILDKQATRLILLSKAAKKVLANAGYKEIRPIDPITGQPPKISLDRNNALEAQMVRTKYQNGKYGNSELEQHETRLKNQFYKL